MNKIKNIPGNLIIESEDIFDIDSTGGSILFQDSEKKSLRMI